MKPKEIYAYELTLREIRKICISTPDCSMCPINPVCEMIQESYLHFPNNWKTDILNTKVVIE